MIDEGVAITQLSPFSELSNEKPAAEFVHVNTT